jgi:hypothetical protein
MFAYVILSIALFLAVFLVAAWYGVAPCEP